MADAATPQAGVFSGLNPAHFNSSDPIVLFIIQVNDKLIISILFFFFNFIPCMIIYDRLQ